MNKLISTIIAVLAALGAPVAASAAETRPEPGQVTLQGDVQLEKTVTENGATRTVLEDPKVVVPGDRLVFSTRYENHGAAPVRNLVVTNPVPPAVTVRGEDTAALQVSVDGGKSFGALAALTVKPDAATAARPATAADITHIRWTIAAIPPGGGGSVGYHGIVR